MNRFLISVKSGRMNSLLSIIAAITIYMVLLTTTKLGLGHAYTESPFIMIMGVLVAPVLSFLLIPFIYRGLDRLVQEEKYKSMIGFVLSLLTLLLSCQFLFLFY